MPDQRTEPTIAAVTLNFGEPEDTLECVRSLLRSAYPRLRIIVVDNGSPAASLRRLRDSLPAGVELIESPVNLGFSGGNNIGIRRALAAGDDYVLLINNDATVQADAVRVLAEVAGRLPKLGILGGKIMVADEKGPTAEIWSAGGRWSPLRASGYHTGLSEEDRGQYDRATEVEFLPACFWMVPARVFRDVGVLEEEFFLYGEDLDFCLQLAEAGYRIHYEPRAVCFHKVSRALWRERGKASSGVNYYTNRNRVRIARKWLSPVQRTLFYLYLFTSRLFLAVQKRDRSYLGGLWDGIRGVGGPRPGAGAP